MNLKCWMGELSDYLKTIPIINLAIPGTHDSMSYTIQPTSPVAPDSDPIVQVLGRLFGKRSRKVIYRWCVTQQLSLSQQLEFGIRYFDLRLSTRKIDDSLFYVHGLYGDEISNSLNVINEFLKNCTEEVVILDFQHFYNFTEENHNILLNEIKSVFGDKLCPLPWDITTVTLAWMIDHMYQVIVIYRHQIVEKEDRFWPGVRWPTPWPQTTSSEVMLQFLTKTLSHRPKNAGFVTQCLLTPDIKFVLWNLCGTLRSTCSVPCYQAALPWLRTQRPGVRGVNVVIADFVDTEGEEFSRTVISLNNLLLKS